MLRKQQQQLQLKKETNNGSLELSTLVLKLTYN